MGAFVDLTGQKFGRLTVIEREKNRIGKTYWRCLCDCGNEVIVNGGNLKNGHTVSCGCARSDSAKEHVKDLTGKRFGRLTVICRAENSKAGEPRWRCACDCGNEIITQGTNLSSGATKSCGCMRRELLRESHTTHGASGTRLLNIWRKMIRRCYDIEDSGYANYGYRGISVCDEWRKDFEAFREWAINNGYSDSLTIDRIDNNGNYCPENCRWADAKTQARNRRSNTPITFNGETHTIVEWAEITGISRQTISDRIQRYNWPVYRALTEPVRKRR